MPLLNPVLAILGNMISDDGATTFKALAQKLSDDLGFADIDDYYFDEIAKYGLERPRVAGLIHLASAQKFGVDLSQSVKNYERALIAAEGNYADLEALALLGASTVHIQQRNLTQAVDILQKRVPALLERIEDTRVHALHELLNATLLSTQGKNQEALEQANQTLASLRKKEVDSAEVSLLAELYNLLGQVFFRMGNHSQAMDNYRASLILAGGIRFEMAKARAFRGMGVIQSINRNSTEAIRCLKQSLDIYELLDYGVGIVQNCISLGQTYLTNSDIRDSQYYLEKAKTRCERIGLLKEQAEIYSKLGNVHAARGDYEAARDYFAKDLEIISTTEDKRAIASAYRNVGWINRKLEDFPVSEQMYRKSTGIFKSFNDTFNEAVTSRGLAEVLIAAGRPDEAGDLLVAAREMFTSLGKTFQVAVADIAMGSLQCARKDYALARSTLESAIRVLREKEPSYDLINAYYQLCLVHREEGDTDKLIVYLKETIGLARHLRNYEMEKISTEMLAEVDPMEWLKMMNAPLVGAVTEELKTERVSMSVLFGDIRGYSTMTSVHDCEIIAELVNEFCDEMSKVVYRYNGFVNKLLGDAVMAIFGLGRKGDPLDPVRAAMEMQEAIERINLRNKDRLGEQIQIGIGIATGEAVAGFFGSPQRREFTVIGNTVNLAARLQSHASGGEVIVCSNTYGEIQDKVDQGRSLTVMCKGFEQPQQVWEIHGLKREKNETISSLLGTPPTVNDGPPAEKPVPTNGGDSQSSEPQPQAPTLMP